MNLVFVVSSNVQAIGYENGILEVHFKSGRVYQYYGTSQELFNAFYTAPSKGKFLHEQIIGHYRCDRIR